MSANDINKMDFKQLRNEVQLLRDELAIMQRKYEDILYNLDDDNFSGTFLREKDGMKTAIKVTAEGLESTVTDFTKKSEELSSKITQNASNISLQANKINENEKSMNSLSVKSDEISSIAKTNITAYFKSSYVPTKTNTTAAEQKMLCLYNDKYYYYNEIEKDWLEYPKDGLQTMFVQTSDGFELQGNVFIDGNVVTTKNLKLSGNVTWDMSNSPVQTQYSSDNTNWHIGMSADDKYMRMSFDGGRNWSTSTKVVGTDGSPAEVTPEAVFDALSEGGEVQGIFPAFYKDGTKIFINAEYIKSGTLSTDRIDTTNLSCTRLYQQGKSSGAYAKINSAYGDFGVYNNLADNKATPTDSTCIYGVYSETGFVELYIYGHQYLQYNGYAKKFYPKGTWDFTDEDCTLILPSGIGGGGNGSLADGNLVIKTTGDSTNGYAVNFYAFGEEDINNFMGYNKDQKTLYAKGDWNFTYSPVNFNKGSVSFREASIDFTDANFQGLDNINVVAKFA